jgi:hypothetical protein
MKLPWLCVGNKVKSVLTVRFTNIFPSHGAAERALGVQAEESDLRQIFSQWNMYYGCVKFPLLDQALTRDQFHDSQSAKKF